MLCREMWLKNSPLLCVVARSALMTWLFIASMSCVLIDGKVVRILEILIDL